MLTFHRFVAALALLAGVLSAASANAQGCGPQNPNCIVTTMPPGDASNRAASDAFVQQAISPFSPPGGSNGQQQYNNNGVFGGFTQSGDVAVSTSTGAATIQPNAVTTNKIADSNVTTNKIGDANVTNAKLAPGAANTVKGSLNGTTTSDLALASCSAVYQFTQWVTGTGWQCGINPVLPSRAIAVTLNLSAFTSVSTLGYATPGDGGGAAFVNVGSTPFRDSNVTAGSITNAGSGCANGTYQNLYLTGGTGNNFTAVVVVAGGIVTSVTPTNGGGAAYSVGDVLALQAANITCANARWTVSAVSAAQASFTDSGGAHWQYVVGGGNFINARQFGCKFNWNRTTGDAGATDDTTCLKRALLFAADVKPDKIQLNAAQTFASTKLVLPAGTALISDTLLQTSSVSVEGQGPFNTFIKTADAGLTGGLGAHVWYICDPNSQVACFGPRISSLGVSAFNTTANSNVYVFWTNAAQQTKVMDNVAIYSGARGCINYEVGYGGAANANFYDIFCTINTGAGSPAINIASTTGTTLLKFFNLIVESGGAGFAGTGFNARAGQIILDGYHTEGVATGVDINMTVPTHSLVLKNSTGGALCTELVKLEATNTPGNFSIENAVKNGCTRIITNGQPGGANFAADVTPALKIIQCSGNPCN